MRNLVALPVLFLLVIVQTALLSRLSLFSGTADIILVWLAGWSLQKPVDSGIHWALLAAGIMGFVSHIPILVVVVGYLAVVWMAKVFSRRVWQAPLLAMFGVTLLGTSVAHAATLTALALAGTVLPLGRSISFVTLPSVILNLLLAIPVFYLCRDLASWVYPGMEAV